MMISFLTILISSILHIQETSHQIEWNAAKRLTWSDFKGDPDPESNNAALTSSSITIEFGYSNRGMTYGIKCRFNMINSWGRIKNELILGHEQGHFDLAELHARKLNKALKAYVFNSRTVSKDVNGIYESIMKEHHKTQEQYDLETDHSRKIETQYKWQLKIAEELKNLELFAYYKK